MSGKITYQQVGTQEGLDDLAKCLNQLYCTLSVIKYLMGCPGSSSSLQLGLFAQGTSSLLSFALEDNKPLPTVNKVFMTCKALLHCVDSVSWSLSPSAIERYFQRTLCSWVAQDLWIGRMSPLRVLHVRHWVVNYWTDPHFIVTIYRKSVLCSFFLTWFCCSFIVIYYQLYVPDIYV